MTSGGNNFNDFFANQLNKFCANTAELTRPNLYTGLPHNTSTLWLCVQSLFYQHFDTFRILTAFKWNKVCFSLFLPLEMPPGHPFPPLLLSTISQQFWPISSHSASTMRASEKCSISTNRMLATLFPMSHRWIVYVSPKSPKGQRVAQNATCFRGRVVNALGRHVQ